MINNTARVNSRVNIMILRIVQGFDAPDKMYIKELNESCLNSM